MLAPLGKCWGNNFKGGRFNLPLGENLLRGPGYFMIARWSLAWSPAPGTRLASPHNTVYSRRRAPAARFVI